jgi:surfeit locus 1 family protein
MTRLIFPLLMGIVGVAVLLGLGAWQVQRLAWKEATLSAISARIADAPGTVPDHPDPLADKYLAVQAMGNLTGQELHILTSHEVGPVYRIIGVLETAGRKVLVDEGYVGLDAKDTPRAVNDVTIRGHLHWPDETDSWTPPPEADIWFSRDVPAMAAALGTEPVLIIAAEMSPPLPGVTPLPIDTSDIPNDHLGYAITWFSLAFVWAIMSGFFIFRMGRRPVKD